MSANSNRIPDDPTFEWSPSRGSTFDKCPRASWFRHVGSWGGWPPHYRHGAHPRHTNRSALLYRLKKLSSRHAVLGDVVHDIARGAVSVASRGEPQDRDTAKRHAWLGLISILRRSAEWMEHRQGKCLVTREHYYSEVVSDHQKAQMRTRLMACIDALTAEPERWDGPLANAPAAVWLEGIRSGRLEVLHVDSSTFDRSNQIVIDGVTVWVDPDLVVRDTTNGDVHAIDWKTGQPDPGHILQATAYAQRAAEKWQAEGAALWTHFVYLEAGKTSSKHWTADTLRSAVALHVMPSIERMRAAWPLEELHPPKVGRLCEFCEFKGACSEGQAYLNPTANEVAA